MPTAKKQPSGKWKVRVYSHVDKDGKQHMRSFTASTKAEAEAMANRFMGKADRAKYVNLTVNETIDGYITAKEGVLSPATIRGYKSVQNTYFVSIGYIKIRKLTSAQVQEWISGLAENLSPKTIRNVYGLLTSSIALYAPEISFRVKLPQKKKNRPVAPSDAQVIALMNAASPNLKKAIAFAAFCSLRRGEICALKYKDITGDTAHVHSDMVHGANGGWVLKDTAKTTDSDRIIHLPDAVLNLIGTGDPDDFVVPITPDSVTELFITLRDKMGIPFKFHDLRRYFASIAAVLQVPDVYTERFGGWRNGSSVMKEIYQGRIRTEEEKYADLMKAHFDNIAKSN